MTSSALVALVASPPPPRRIDERHNDRCRRRAIDLSTDVFGSAGWHMVRCVADSASSGAVVIGVLGGVLGTIVWLRWKGTKSAYGGWKTAKAGVPKAKAGVGKAFTAFGLAVRGLILA